MKKIKSKVDIARPNTWVKFRPSLCHGCNAGCCTMPVTVSSEELFHMGFIDYDQVNGPLKRIAARLQKQGIIGAYYHLTRTFRLKQVNGLDCIFLGSDRACTIYDRRPKICREFPDNGARPGYCPSQKKPTTTL